MVPRGRGVLVGVLVVLLAMVGITTTEQHHRVRRYALEGSRWRPDQLTYHVSKYSKKLPKDVVDRVLRKAFNSWEDITNLEFTENKSGKGKVACVAYATAEAEAEA